MSFDDGHVAGHAGHIVRHVALAKQVTELKTNEANQAHVLVPRCTTAFNPASTDPFVPLYCVLLADRASLRAVSGVTGLTGMTAMMKSDGPAASPRIGRGTLASIR